MCRHMYSTSCHTVCMRAVPWRFRLSIFDMALQSGQPPGQTRDRQTDGRTDRHKTADLPHGAMDEKYGKNGDRCPKVQCASVSHCTSSSAADEQRTTPTVCCFERPNFFFISKKTRLERRQDHVFLVPSRPQDRRRRLKTTTPLNTIPRKCNRWSYISACDRQPTTEVRVRKVYSLDTFRPSRYACHTRLTTVGGDGVLPRSRYRTPGTSSSCPPGE